MDDYYDVLEVSPTASAEELRQQYLFLMQAWHPDKFAAPSHKKRAEEKCKQINAAYDVLRDADRRAEYDRQRRGEPSRVRAETQRWSPPPEPPARQPAPPPPPVDFEQPWDEDEWIRIFFEQARRRQSARPRPNADAAPIRALVVDDAAKTRADTCRMLGRAADIRVVGEASSGQEALRQFDALRPDVMITGLRLPTLDGLAATQALRRVHPMAKVIIVSEHSSVGYIRQAAMAGACDFLTRPLRAADLLAAVRLAGSKYETTDDLPGKLHR